MDRTHHADIRIGTLASMTGAREYLPQILPHGFESFQLTNWQHVEVKDLKEFGKQILDICGDQATIGALGCYGNPLTDEQTAKDFGRLIKHAKDFGTNVVCGFAGAIEDKPIDEQMDQFVKVWQPLARLAEDEGVKIGFENCDMGGHWLAPKWNIAHAPRAWRMMFDAVDSPALGLEWEPCHQMVSLIDPLPQLEEWVDRVVHIHGKDATIDRAKIAREGIRCGEFVVLHRTPGFGDTNWHDVISILRRHGWTGAIDIEGWHDPVYKDDLEMTGQVYGLNYLKACRGGDYIANPT